MKSTSALITVDESTFRKGECLIRATKNPNLLYREAYRLGRARVLETLCEDTVEPLARAVKLPMAPGVYPPMRGYALHPTVIEALKTAQEASERRSAFLRGFSE